MVKDFDGATRHRWDKGRMPGSTILVRSLTRSVEHPVAERPTPF